MGYTVGLYTSPHFIRLFRAYSGINGQVIAKEYVVDFVQEHHSLSCQNSVFLRRNWGWLWLFESKKVDYAVIEVGLGGRLDATNIITPQLAVITNIGLDHTEFLGDSLAEILIENRDHQRKHSSLL